MGMGDRTSVELAVLNSHAATAEEMFVYAANIKEIGECITYFYFDDINYGELPFLNALLAAGIAYSSEWQRGGEFGPGCSSCRFTADGEAETKELYEGDQDPSITQLLQYIDEPHKLRSFILEYKEKVSVLPWDNQEEYGKIYRIKQLILPTT